MWDPILLTRRRERGNGRARLWIMWLENFHSSRNVGEFVLFEAFWQSRGFTKSIKMNHLC
jgi:hypothetical protein